MDVSEGDCDCKDCEGNGGHGNSLEEGGSLLSPIPDDLDVYNWKDVTDEFMGACEELELGELLHDSSFGLFEAMSAIEMMDPKMDAGMMCNQAKHKVLSLEQGIQEGTVKTNDISLVDLIGIIDDTLACLVTWLEGHSLAQTVFTNLYMHNPYLIEDRPLKAFCICFLKTVDLIRDRINRAAVFEEEDFQPMTYGFKMATDVTDMRCTGMIKEVEEDLNRIIKNTRSKPGEDRNPETQMEHDVAVAAYSRLKFCRLFFSTLLAFSREKCQGIEDAQKSLKHIAELLPIIRRTLPLGVKPEITEGTSQDYPTIMGFEPLVNQRLLPPTFPRYTKIKSREETICYIEELSSRLKVVTDIVDINGYHSVVEFFTEFSKPSPCVLSRSLLQSTFLPPSRRVFGTQNVVDYLRDAIRAYIAPPVLMYRSPIANCAQAKECVDAFLTHAVRPMTTLAQISGNNRARQRDKWGHLLEEFSSMQEAAEKVDAYLHSLKLEPAVGKPLACFATWTLYHILHVMIHYILAGFELELYAIHEYHYIFWYLYECLFSWLIATLTRAETFLLEQEAFLEQQKGRGKKNKKKKKTRPHHREVLFAQGCQYMCGGFYKVMMGFVLDGKLKQPEFEFDSEEVRYNHRFAPFGCLLTPPAVQYGQFKDMSDISRFDPPLSVDDMYNGALQCFQKARTHLEGITNPNEEVQTLIKVMKTNYVVMKLLLGGHKKDSKVPPDFDFSQHRVFPVIKIS